MNKPKRKASGEKPEELFGRIVSILEEARGNVLRAVNTNMVMAYWLIGREIVEEVQGGEERAAYGKKVIEELSARLNERYGQGFSFRNLELFKQFYLSYKERFTILRPSGAEFGTSQIVRPMGTESSGSEIYLPMGRKLEILSPPGIESGFSPQLSWSHYRALMRVNSVDARDFYEREAIAGGWDKNIGENTQLCCLFRAEGPSRYKPSPEPDSALAEPRDAGQRSAQIAGACARVGFARTFSPRFIGSTDFPARLRAFSPQTDRAGIGSDLRPECGGSSIAYCACAAAGQSDHWPDPLHGKGRYGGPLFGAERP
jgi:hypothetical protein